VWIPVALISWSSISILNWIFIGLGFALSVSFLLRNLYPVLSATDRQTSKILLILVVALHLGLAIAIKVLFFAAGSPVADKPAEGGDAGGDAGGDPPADPPTF
jgi:protein YIPF1/2